jgi:hypothetical protein
MKLTMLQRLSLGRHSRRDQPERQSLESAGTGDHRPTPALAEWQPVELHARRLFHWLRERGHVNGTILATDLMELYEQMTLEIAWLPRAWNPVARAYSLVSSNGVKRYVWVSGRRLRIHILPASNTRPLVTAALRDSRGVRRVAA